jgi:hypothetical protein
MGTGRNSPERVDGLKRNQWTEWIGMGGRISPEWVDGIGRNTQSLEIAYPSRVRTSESDLSQHLFNLIIHLGKHTIE